MVFQMTEKILQSIGTRDSRPRALLRHKYTYIYIYIYIFQLFTNTWAILRFRRPLLLRLVAN